MRILSMIALAVLVGLGGTMTVTTDAVADAVAKARKYELTRNNVQKPENVDSTMVSLYGVRLGDSEIDAVEMLVNEKISGVRAEQEGVFVLLWDQSNPTGAMAGVQILDGRVTLIFINNRFVHKTRGIFRRVLTAQSAKEIRELLGPEDFGGRKRHGGHVELPESRLSRELPGTGHQRRIHASVNPPSTSLRYACPENSRRVSGHISEEGMRVG